MNRISPRRPRNRTERVFRWPPINTTEKNKKLASARKRRCDGCTGGSSMAVAAVVVMVILEGIVEMVPLARIDGGENVQAAPVGSPEHESEIVPVKPVDHVNEAWLCPDEPGAETTMVDNVLGTTKKPGVIVKVCDCVVLLGLKLASPL